MSLNAPEWLLLLPALALLHWMVPGWFWWKRPVRVLAVLLLVLTLADPQIARFGSGLDLWLLEDHSASDNDMLVQHRSEIEALLTHSKNSGDSLHIIDFAEGATLRESEDQSHFEGDPNGTRLSNAINLALSHIPPNRSARILTVTDGYVTDNLADVSQPLIQRQIAFDYRLLQNTTADDYQVDYLHTPTQVRPGEPFLIDLQVSGSPDATVPYNLLCDNHPIGHSQIQVINGVGNARFTNRLVAPGTHHYQVQILPEHDSISGNNMAESYVQVLSGSRVLVITKYTDDPLVQALQSEGVAVDLENTPANLEPGRLTGAKGVIINNVPANEIPSRFLSSLTFFVNDQGGGLMMTGGKTSFGSGGYFHSAIDDLLPVSMEQRKENRKLQLAMAILLDRSGSMGMAVAHGMTKMDLADDGAADALELLSPQDLVSVTAVDTEPHIVVPLTQVGNDAPTLAGPVRHIASEGGGIFCYTALKSGYEQLKDAQTGTRHVILFADACDAEEHGDYIPLVKQMVTDGITVSTIGMGKNTDPDAEYLQDVARIGGGRCFFANDPNDIPKVFAQETVSVARSTFVHDSTPFTIGPGWQELAGHTITGITAVDGYNLSYLKPTATEAWTTKDEYNAPLIAFWQRGLGRSMAVSFPVAGDSSDTVRNWKNYGDFSRTLVRWLLGPDTPPGIGVKTRLIGNNLEVTLLFDATWQQQISLHPPSAVLELHDSTGMPVRSTADWQKIAPGRYSLQVELPPTRYASGAIQLPPYVIPFGPIVAGINPEWTRTPEQINEVKALSAATGGQQRLNLSDIWSAPRPTGTTPLRNQFLIALIVVLLLEFLLTRLGVRWPAK